MKTAKILIADDEKIICSILKETLTQAGHDVVISRSGKEVLRKAAKVRPDLILLDRMLGDMLGEEVAEKLKLSPKTDAIPIVFLSGQITAQEARESSHLLGGHPMFSKSNDLNGLINAVEELLTAQEQAV